MKEEVIVKSMKEEVIVKKELLEKRELLEKIISIINTTNDTKSLNELAQIARYNAYQGIANNLLYPNAPINEKKKFFSALLFTVRNGLSFIENDLYNNHYFEKKSFSLNALSYFLKYKMTQNDDYEIIPKLLLNAIETNDVNSVINICYILNNDENFFNYNLIHCKTPFKELFVKISKLDNKQIVLAMIHSLFLYDNCMCMADTFSYSYMDRDNTSNFNSVVLLAIKNENVNLVKSLLTSVKHSYLSYNLLNSVHEIANKKNYKDIISLINTIILEKKKTVLLKYLEMEFPCEIIEKTIIDKISKLVKKFITLGGSPNFKSIHNNTLLMLVASIGDSDLAKLLLEKGADPCLKDKNGCTFMDMVPKNKRQDFEQMYQMYTEKLKCILGKATENMVPNRSIDITPTIMGNLML